MKTAMGIPEIPLAKSIGLAVLNLELRERHILMVFKPKLNSRDGILE